MRPAVLKSALGGLALSLAAATLAGAPTMATASAGAAAVDPPQLTVGSYNVRAGVSLPEFKTVLDAYKEKGVEVAGLQEIGSNDRNKYLREDHHWGYYRPPALQQNPIIWDRSLFDFLDARGYMIAEERDLHGEHTGDEAKGDSWATVVRLRDRETGQELSFMNVHLVRGAVKGGRPNPDRPNLFKLYADQVVGMVKAVQAERALSDRVYVMGDFNVGWKADNKWRHKKLPFRKFKAIGFRSTWQASPYLSDKKGTHNDALIDQVWTEDDSTNEQIFRDLTASDHWPMLSTYELPLPEAGYKPGEGLVGFDPEPRLVNNGNQPGDTENDGPSKLPSIFVDLDWNPQYGYLEIQVVEESAKLSSDGNAPGDFAIDDSSLYDNDLTNDHIAIDIVGDTQVEGDETFTLRLVNPVNAKIDAQADEIRITIKDDRNG